jgi:hypothetical protein
VRGRSAGKREDGRGKPVWTYAYEIVPPQGEGRLGTIKHLLARESADARGRAQTWVGRVVLQQQVTHILVVSDSPEQDHEANRRLEAELRDLKVEYSITAALAVADGASPSSEWPSSH